MNIKTVNLFNKGIYLVCDSVDGHRHYRAVHKASGLEGEGRSEQAAFDDLMDKMA